MNFSDETHYLNCAAFAQNDKQSMENYIKNGRLTVNENSSIAMDMDCGSIRNRILVGGSDKFRSLNRKIAHARNIYRFYEQQEVFLSISYHPDNVYCYAMDVKSDESFKLKMKTMASCFPNIHILDKEYNFTSTGKLQDSAHIDCLKEVISVEWDHVLLLQNDDMLIKSVHQISNLSETLGNISLIENEEAFKHRYNRTFSLTPAALNLFKNVDWYSENELNQTLIVRKTMNQVMLSRPFVTSMFEKLNLEGIIQFFDNDKYHGVDEMLFSTLYFNYLGLDSQIEANCSKSMRSTTLRYVIWSFNTRNPVPPCLVNKTRHGVCVFGVEYLPLIVKNPAVIANKVLSNYDFGTVLCLEEFIQKELVSSEANSNQLMEWPQYREKILQANGSFNMSELKC